MGFLAHTCRSVGLIVVEIKNMIKKVIGLTTVSFLLMAGTAFGAVNFDGIAPVVFDAGNGFESNVDTDAGNTINAKLILDITGDDDVNAVSYDFIGDFIPKVCIQLSQEQTQSVNDFPVEIDIVAPNTAGSWDVQFVAYGNNGPENDFNCTNAVDTLNVNDRIIVNIGNTNAGGSTGGGSGTVGNSALAQLSSLVQTLANQVSCYGTGGTWSGSACVPKASAPAATGKCAVLATKMAGGMQGSTASGNIVLQGYLLSEGANIPALAAGAAFGYWGPQTQAAVGWFKSVNSCN